MEDLSLVTPFYLSFLHGNFVHERAELPGFIADLESVLPFATADVLARLLRGGWRERLSAAWFIALQRLDGFDDQLAALLLASETCFAGQGYCLAFARRATPVGVAALRAYLAKFLPVGERPYDQDWALGALDHLDPAAAAAITREPADWKPLDPQQGIGRIALITRELDAAGF